MGKRGQDQKKKPPVNGTYKQGDQVEVEYQGEWLIGIVTGVDGSAVHVMALCGPITIINGDRIRRANFVPKLPGMFGR